MNAAEKTAKIIEKFAAGIRQMKITPDAFLFCDSDINKDDGEDDEVFYRKEICGIPIFHSCFIMNHMACGNVPFIPIWFEPNDRYTTERHRFNEAYSDY